MRERLFIWLALAHGAMLLAVPSTPLIAIGLWWNANTIAHNFIHRPFFGSRAGNRAFSAYLSLVQGVPQSLWRARHLAHHAGRDRGPIDRSSMMLELTLLATLWAGLAIAAPRFLMTVYVPGIAIGLALCWLQGHFEHARGTTSHYGRVYNALFFNDGYHVEHHRYPGVDWRQLPRLAPPSAAPSPSRWPAVLRWLEWLT